MADNFLFTNNASALLAASISDVDTTISLEAGKGALFPSPTGSQEFRAALQDANGNLEIVQVTARSVDNLTVVRAQEGTTGLAWTLGVTRLELRLTEETMEELVQKNGATMTGPLDMDENNLVDAQINGANTKFTAGQIIAVPLRGADGDSSNEVAVPGDGTRATAGGSAVLTQADLASNGGLNLLPINTILMWFGSLGSLPAGWQNCDGTGGSPDLRGQFVRGAGGSISLGATGGAATASGNTGSSGGGTTGSHTLTESQIPSHKHLDGATVRYKPGDAFGQTPDNGHVINNGENIWEHHQFRNNNTSAKFYGESVGGGGGHTHTLTAHTHTLGSISTIPPYTGIYYIMKVS